MYGLACSRSSINYVLLLYVKPGTMTFERQTLGFGDTTGRLLWVERGTKREQVSKAKEMGRGHII